MKYLRTAFLIDAAVLICPLYIYSGSGAAKTGFFSIHTVYSSLPEFDKYHFVNIKKHTASSGPRILKPQDEFHRQQNAPVIFRITKSIEIENINFYIKQHYLSVLSSETQLQRVISQQTDFL